MPTIISEPRSMSVHYPMKTLTRSGSPSNFTDTHENIRFNLIKSEITSFGIDSIAWGNPSDPMIDLDGQREILLSARDYTYYLLGKP